MKILTISFSTLILVFALVVWNFFLINNIYEYMTKEVTALKEDSYESIASLIQYWNKKRILISLSIPHRVSDELEKNLIIMKAKIEHQSIYEFEEARYSLLNSLEEMKVHAGISLDTVL